MRYDLVLHRVDGKTAYVGQATSRDHAREWAEKRLGRDDVKYGDKVTAHPVGEPQAAFTVD